MMMGKLVFGIWVGLHGGLVAFGLLCIYFRINPESVIFDAQLLLSGLVASLLFAIGYMYCIPQKDTIAGYAWHCAGSLTGCSFFFLLHAGIAAFISL